MGTRACPSMPTLKLALFNRSSSFKLSSDICPLQLFIDFLLLRAVYSIFSPHRQHYSQCLKPVTARAVGTDVARSVVCQLMDTRASPAKTVEPQVYWLGGSLVGLKNPCIRWGPHWHYLANMTEPRTTVSIAYYQGSMTEQSVLGGDAGFAKLPWTPVSILSL